MQWLLINHKVLFISILFSMQQVYDAAAAAAVAGAACSFGVIPATAPLTQRHLLPTLIGVDRY